MQIDGYVQALRDDLARVAAVGDESTARAAELLARRARVRPSAGASRRRSARRRSSSRASSTDGRIEVRIAGGDPELVLVRDEAAPPPSPPTRRSRPGSRSGSRRASRRGSRPPPTREGVSVNTWLVHVLAHAAEPRGHSGGSRRRLTGYGRS